MKERSHINDIDCCLFDWCYFSVERSTLKFTPRELKKKMMTWKFLGYMSEMEHQQLLSR